MTCSKLCFLFFFGKSTPSAGLTEIIFLSKAYAIDVFLFDFLLLSPTWNWIGRRIRIRSSLIFIQSILICFICSFLQSFRFVICLYLFTVSGMFYCMNSGLCQFFTLMCGLNTHILILILCNLPMHMRRNCNRQTFRGKSLCLWRFCDLFHRNFGFPKSQLWATNRSLFSIGFVLFISI